jgi:hypothetical protein
MDGEQTPFEQRAMPELIATAVNTVMRGVRTLLKTERNGEAGYRFASIDGFLAAINPLCAKAELIIVQNEIDARLVHNGVDPQDRSWLWTTFEFHLAHASGAMWGPITRSVMVAADGAQAFGAAQSYALKQFMRALFQIPTGDAEDADFVAANPHRRTVTRGRTERPQPSPGPVPGPRPRHAPPERPEAPPAPLSSADQGRGVADDPDDIDFDPHTELFTRPGARTVTRGVISPDDRAERAGDVGTTGDARVARAPEPAGNSEINGKPELAGETEIKAKAEVGRDPEFAAGDDPPQPPSPQRRPRRPNHEKWPFNTLHPLTPYRPDRWSGE